MPRIDHSSYIKGSAAKYNGTKGNLLLSADGIWFVPDDGGAELYLPIEKIMDAHLDGYLMKKISVIVNASNDRYLFSVEDKDGWKAAISLAAGIYRRIATGTSVVPKPAGNGQSKPQANANASSPPAAPAPTPQPSKPQTKKKKNQPAQPAAQKPAPTPPPSPAPAQSAPVQPTTSATQAPVQTSPVAAPAKMATGRSSTIAAYSGPWPSGQDYEQSFQTIKLSMNPVLGNVDQWEAVKNPKTPGWYVYASGNYGSIYKIKGDNDKYFALKCFTRKSANLNERYFQISDYLSKNSKGLDFLAHFQYFEQGVRTRKSQSFYFPVLRMEWIEGVTLNRYIQDNIANAKILKKVSVNLMNEIDKMQRAGMGHGDLAGDNIIVTNAGGVKLVDYDGMYIPNFNGQKSAEMGHADFQHPGRTADTFSNKLDNFSALIIHLSLSAISEKPTLWEKYNGSDPDCLIIRKKDFMNLDISPVYKELKSMRSRKIKKLCSLLEDYLSHGPLWDGASPSTLASL